MKDGKIIIECDCHSHLLHVASDEEMDCFFLAMFHIRDFGYTWKKRLRACWTILTTGNPYTDQLILSREEAKKFTSFILKQTENENSTQEKEIC